MSKTGAIVLLEQDGLTHLALVFENDKSYLACSSDWFERFDESLVSKKEMVTCLKCLSGTNRGG